MTALSFEKPAISRQHFSWRVFWILLTLIAFGLLSLLPYSMTIAGIAFSLDLIPQLVAQFFVQLGLYALLATFGMRMWPRTGLGAPLLEGHTATSQWKSIWHGLATGLTCGLMVTALDIFFFTPRLDVEFTAPGVVQPLTPAPSPWQGFLAAFYGGIVEEVLLRLFLMTLLVWLGARLFQNGKEHLHPTILWAAILISGLALGLGHLPGAAVTGIPLTPLYITRILALNAIGIVFGWLYWQRGFESAMAAHFAADIALHVIGALVLG